MFRRQDCGHWTASGNEHRVAMPSMCDCTFVKIHHENLPFQFLTDFMKISTHVIFHVYDTHIIIVSSSMHTLGFLMLV